MIKTIEMPLYDYALPEGLQTGTVWLAYVEEDPMVNAEGATRIEAAGKLAMLLEDHANLMESTDNCRCSPSKEHLCPFNTDEGCTL